MTPALVSPEPSSKRIMAAALSVALGVGALPVVLNHYASRRAGAAVQLEQYEIDIAAINLLEREASGGRETGHEVLRSFTEARTRAAGHLRSLGATWPRPSGLKALLRLDEAYLGAVEQGLGLLAAGRLEEAAAARGDRVDPAFAVLSRSIADMSAGLAREAAVASEVADTGTVVVLLAATVAIAVLFLRYGRARELAERALVFGENPQPMWIYDLATLAFLDVNDVAVERYGYSREEFLSMTIADIRPPEDVPRLLENVAHVVPGFTRDDSWRHRKKDGSLIDVEIVSHPVKIKGRRAEFILAHDVTEKRRAEKRIELLAHAIRSVSECVSITDERNTILFVNEAFLKTYGYREDELIGQSIEIVRASPEVTPPTGEILLATIGGGWQGEFVNRRKDGSEFPISLSTSVVKNDTGRPVALIGVASDITERRRAEEEIRRLNAELEDRVKSRTAQLEAVNRDMEAFSHSVSHDLRAPVRAIDGYSKMLLRSQEDRLDPEGKRLLGVIREQTLRMAQLIEDLLSLSRVGRREIRHAQVDIAEVVEKVWLELVAQDPDPPAELRLQPLKPAHGDPALVRQLFTNLLSNALKFSSRCERRVVEVGCAAAADETAYYVKDNGAGFDQKYAGKLFGVFERLHGQKEFPGTGVGLSIVKRIVERHEGRVWAEGEPGVGATFYFTLSRRPAMDMAEGSL